MAREQAKGIKKPKDKFVPDVSGNAEAVATGDDLADLKGYTGPDGSKSIGYLEHPPGQDNSGLGADADDAGRTEQAPGQNSGANQIPPAPPQRTKG